MNRVKRAKSREIFIEGTESIKQALKAGLDITRIITTRKKSDWAEGVIKQYEGKDKKPEICRGEIKIIEMTDDLYNKLCDRSDPSEMLVTARINPASLKDLKFQDKPFILVLDRISDTGNLGSIIRSADSFGVDAILLMGHAVDIWAPKTIRASMGSVLFNAPVQSGSLEEFGDFIKSMRAIPGIEILGTDSLGSVSLSKKSLKRPLVLILGNEARGMSLGLKELCDGIVGIPVSGNVNSLNLASAASIFMWEVFRNSISKERIL